MTKIRTQKKRCIDFLLSSIFGLVTMLFVQAIFLCAIGLAVYKITQYEKPLVIALYLTLLLPVGALVIWLWFPLLRILLQGILNSFTALSIRLDFSEVEIVLKVGTKKWEVSKSTIKYIFRCPKFLMFIWESDGRHLAFLADQGFFGKKGLAVIEQAINIKPEHFLSQAAAMKTIKSLGIEYIGGKSFRCYRVFLLPWGKNILRCRNDVC